MSKTQVPGKLIADGINGIDLTVDVTGVLPIANGGTGTVDLTLNSPIISGGSIANARIAKRLGTGTTSSGAISFSADSYDTFTATITAATAITITGSPTHSQPLLMEFTASAAYALTFATTGSNQVISSGLATILAITAVSKICRMGLIYDSTRTAWVAMAVDAAGY
jgi:hypothetical protein